MQWPEVGQAVYVIMVCFFLWPHWDDGGAVTAVVQAYAEMVAHSSSLADWADWSTWANHAVQGSGRLAHKFVKGAAAPQFPTKHGLPLAGTAALDQLGDDWGTLWIAHPPMP
eukprot:1531490-Prorocentrum_lima.AAC.1